MARLVNKQFNSPIGLYSQQNIQDVLDRESHLLENGAVGIDFNNPDVGKPKNLQNSAVLRMLEEEENRQRNGYGPGSDRLLKPLRAWPPPEYEQKSQLRSSFKDVVIPGVKRVAWPPPHETGQNSPYIEQNPVQTQGGPQYPSQAAGYQNNYQQPKPAPSNQALYQQQRAPLKLDVSQGGSSPLASPLSNQSPQAYRAPTPNKNWASVQSPVHTPNQPAWRQSSPSRFQAAHQPVSQQQFLGQQYSGPSQPNYSPNQGSQQYQPPVNQYQPQQQYQQPQNQYQQPQQQYQAPQQQYQAPQQQYQAPQQQYQAPQQQYQAPQQQYQPPQQQYQPPQNQYQPQQSQNQFSSVAAQAVPYQYPSEQQYQTQSTQQYQYSQQYQSSEQSHQSQPQGYQSVPQTSQVHSVPIQVQRQTSKPVEPPPSTITLRPQAPVSQAPPPVYTSQPATATLKVYVNPKNLRGDLKWPPEDVKQKMYEEAENLNTSNSFLSIQGGKHLRGDMKWPPENVKVQAEEENRLRLELAKGPVCRPRKVHRDYTEFFDQHALNSSYPGYKIPPGTQFYRAE
uniref:Mediator of RNA polymerase II transcription subunit 26 isoform X1 n=1 Tax=Diabrotica virgifera virgifera TaxID=50390 RepID=A0A6P7G864_DIAVI